MDKKLNSSIFKVLFTANFFYLNPQINDMYAKKYEHKDIKNLGLKLFRKMSIGSALVGMIFYAIIAVGLPLRQAPFLLDFLYILISLMVFTQSFIYFYNVFFEGDDVEYLTCLPIAEKDIVKSKYSILLSQVATLLTPLIPLTIGYGIKNGMIVTGIISGIVIPLCLMVIFSSVETLLIKLVIKSKFLIKYQKQILTGTTAFGGIVLLVFYIGTPRMSTSVFSKYFGFYGPLSYMLRSNLLNLITVGIFLVLAFLSYSLATKQLSNGFYNYISRINAEKTNNDIIEEKIVKNNSLKSIVDFNTKMTCKGDTMLGNTMITMYIFSFIIFIMIFVSSSYTTITTDTYNWQTNLIYILLIGISTSYAPYMNCVNIASIMFSADGEGFNMIRALPIRPRDYAIIKIVYVLKRTLIIPIIPIIATTLYLKLNLLIIIPMILVSSIVTISMVIRWLAFDIKHLSLDSGSIGALFQRQSKAVQIFTFIPAYMLVIMGFSLSYIFIDMKMYYIPLTFFSIAFGLIIGVGIYKFTVIKRYF